MYSLVRIDKRIPDGSIWQARREYALEVINGWARTLGPAGTRWSNRLGGWATQVVGMSLFHPDAAFTIACHGPADEKRFYIDVARRVRIGSDRIEFEDLFLDVMIDPEGLVTEKDEYQLAVLPAELQAFARSARDEIRRLIDSGDPLFDPRSLYYAVSNEGLALPPAVEPLEI